MEHRFGWGTGDGLSHYAGERKPSWQPPSSPESGSAHEALLGAQKVSHRFHPHQERQHALRFHLLHQPGGTRITATSEHKVLELTLELWRLHKAPGGHRAHSSVPPGPFGHPFPKGPGRAGPIYTTQCHQHSPRGTFIPASQHLSHLLGASRGSQLAPLKLPPLASGGSAAAGSSGSASLASGKGQTR